MSEPTETVLRRVRTWAKLAIPAVVIGSLGTSWLNGWLQPMGLASGALWAAAAAVGLRRPWVRALETLALLACFAFVGPAAIGLFGITIAIATMSLRLGTSITYVLGLTAAATGMLLAFPPPFLAVGIRPFGLGVPALVMFAVGRALRSGVVQQSSAERHAAELGETNLVLENNLASAAKLASTRERSRIARELHDSLGHCLTTAHVHIQLAEHAHKAGSETAGEALGHAGAAVRLGLAELRRCVAVMRDPETMKPLSEVMRSFLDQRPNTELLAEFRVEGTERKLGAEREFVLFRTLQEALTNATKHASARTVRICLRYSGRGGARLEISDDGRGAASIQGGFGLAGLTERVEAAGGHLGVRTNPGAGFHLTVDLGDPS